MKRERGDRRGGTGGGSGGGNREDKPATKETADHTKLDVDDVGQIEYLLYQSTQGLHFMFDHADIARILSVPEDASKFFTEENMKRVQELLTGLLDAKSLDAKRSYLDRLPVEQYELLVRAYFHLVENTILAHSNIRH